MKSRKFRYVALVAGSMAVGATLLAQINREPAPAAPIAPAVDPEKVVLVVGESKMTAGQFEEFISALPPEVQFMARGPAKRRIAEDLVKLKLLANEARRKGLDQTPKFQQQMELMRDNALAGALYSELQETLVTDQEIKEHYDANKEDYERVTARHILIPTRGDQALTEEQAQAKAEDVRKRLMSGEDFAAIARAESADGSKDEGGDLDPFTRGQMVPDFEKAAFELKVNEISQPVKTEFGYHIIQVRQRDLIPFDEVKGAIGEELRPEKLEQVVEDLRKKTSPTLDDSFFGPPQPDAPAAPPVGR